MVNRRASALSSAFCPQPVVAGIFSVFSFVFLLISAPAWGQTAHSGAAPARRQAKWMANGEAPVPISKSFAVAPQIKMTAKAPANRPPTQKSAAVMPPAAPVSLPGFALAPLRVGRTLAKVAEAGTIGMATGSGPRFSEDVSGKIGGVAAQVRNAGLSVVAADGDTEELANPTLRPQVSAHVLSKPDFVLPKTLRSKELDRKVRVRVHVDADGCHTERLLTSSGNADLDAALLENLRQWRWEPARQDDRLAASFLQMTLPIKN